jgi:hypothetical protein
MSQTVSPFLLRKTYQTQPYGFSTTISLRQCTGCSRKSIVSTPSATTSYRQAAYLFADLVRYPVFLTACLYLLSILPAREEVVGFYSSGPKIKENDIKVRPQTAFERQMRYLPSRSLPPTSRQCTDALGSLQSSVSQLLRQAVVFARCFIALLFY